MFSLISSDVDRPPGPLEALGVETGEWPLPEGGGQRLPHLVWARQLLELQRRHGAAVMDRVSIWPGRTHAQQAWHEPRAEHVHDEAEVRVVVGGQARLHLRSADRRHTATLPLAPGRWFVLPARLAHRLELDAQPRLDLLRLFASRPGGAARDVAG